jgi:hypothetical protein
MSKFDKGDYVIGQTVDGKTNKPFLFKVTGIHKGIVTGNLEKDTHIQTLRSTVEVPAKDIIAVLLGDEPHPGKAYGCDTTMIYRGRKTHEHFGALTWFYKPETEVGERVVKAFDKVYKILKQQRLEFTLQPESCVWEILPYTGEKYAGMYKRSRKPEDNPHRFQMRPECMQPTDYTYVIAHEWAHHLHSEFATGKKLNAAWVRLYNTSIKVEDIPKEKSQELLTSLLDQQDLPSDFRGQLDEDDAIAFKWIVKAIQQQHKISIKELDLLFDAEFKDDIKALWPISGVSKSDLEPVVSEYATKNVRELFADSVSFYLIGKSLPKTVTALVEKTLSYARSNHEKG